MKKKRAVGPEKVLVEVWKIVGNVSIRLLKDIFNRVLVEGKMTSEWRKSVVLPIFKGKETCKNVEIIEV